MSNPYEGLSREEAIQRMEEELAESERQYELSGRTLSMAYRAIQDALDAGVPPAILSNGFDSIAASLRHHASGVLEAAHNSYPFHGPKVEEDAPIEQES